MELNTLDVTNLQFFYDVSTLKEHVEQSVDNYFEIVNSSSIDQYEHFYTVDEDTGDEYITQPTLSAFFIRNSYRNSTMDFKANLTQEDLGPFNWPNGQLRDFISNTTNLKIKYQIKHCIPSESATPFDCFRWIIYQNFDFSSRNHISETLTFERFYLDIFNSNRETRSNPNFLSTYVWLNLLNIVFSLYSLILHLLHFKQVHVMYNSMTKYFKNRKKRSESSYSKINSAMSQEASEVDKTVSDSTSVVSDTTIGKAKVDFDSLTLADKLMLYSGWTFVIIFADILHIIGSIFLITSTTSGFIQSSVLLGISSLLHWCALLKYMENIKGYNIIANTFMNSATIVVKSMAGVVPLLLGFVVFGMCTFASSNRFGSISLAMYSLYSLMNGDSIFDIYYDIQQLEFLIALLFMLFFIFISNSVVQNVFIVIIGDAYVKSKYYHKNDWIKPTDEFGRIIKQDDDEEDPLKPFYNKTQKEIDSRKAIVKMLMLEKQMIQNKLKAKNLTRGESVEKGRVTEILERIQNVNNTKESEVKLNEDKLTTPVLKMSIIKYLIVLNDVFDIEMKNAPADQNLSGTGDETTEDNQANKEDIYDRYVN